MSRHLCSWWYCVPLALCEKERSKRTARCRIKDLLARAVAFGSLRVNASGKLGKGPGAGCNLLLLGGIAHA